MFKKFCTVCLVALLCLCLVGCGKGNATPADGNTATDSGSQPAVGPGDGSVLGDFVIGIVGCEKMTTYEGENAIRIYYTFTNNSDATTSATSSLWGKAFQNGVELSTGMSDESVAEEYNYQKGIRPGVTIRVAQVFVLSDESEVAFEVSEFMGFSDAVVTGTFDLAALPPVPEADPVVTVSNPTGIEGLDAAGTLGSFDVEIQDFAIVEDYTGADALRVFFTFTNNSAETTSFFFAVDAYAYQDNIQLDSAFPTDDCEEEGNYSKDVQPGASVEVACSFVLMSDSPVEIEVSEFFSSDEIKIGKVFNVE